MAVLSFGCLTFGTFLCVQRDVSFICICLQGLLSSIVLCIIRLAMLNKLPHHFI
jgi:hypothetical protein